MTEQQKTHYRKAFNSPYLSSADIVEPTVLTISDVRFEPDKTRKTKDYFNTAYFAEKEIRPGEALKPMILNAINSRTMKDLAESHFLEDWNNVPVTIYVDPNVRFGRETVEGLRISTTRANTQKPELTPTQSKRWAHAVAAYKRDGKLDAVLEHVRISDENQSAIKEQANVA